MTAQPTPPLSNGSSSASPDSTPSHPSPPASQLPDYAVAVGAASAASASSSPGEVDQIARTLTNASLKICDGPGLSPAERKELDKALKEGVKIGLNTMPQQLIQIDEIKQHLRLIDLFDRLRQAVHDGTEYFDYPTCHHDQGHIDVPGIDAPPPPYAPTAEPPPITNSKSGHQPTKKEADQAAAELSLQLTRERRWGIYLNRAAYRLELWLTFILTSDRLTAHLRLEQDADKDKALGRTHGFELPTWALPPVDVALMLHSYHLNPLTKTEDTERMRTRRLLAFYNFPLKQLAERIHDTLPIFNNVEDAQYFWDDRITRQRSKQPWDLSLQPPPGHPTNAQESNGGTIFGLRINCPRCSVPQYIPWTGIGKEPHELGIGELGWQRNCADTSDCEQPVSAEHLQMRRFLDDFRKWRVSPGRPSAAARDQKVFFMAGTMLASMNAQRSARDYMGDSLFVPIFKHEKPNEASKYMDRRVAPNAELQEIEHVAVQCDYNLSVFRNWLEERWTSAAIQPRLKLPEEKAQQMARIAILMRPYQNGNAAAYGEGLCDLVDAVKRQSFFNTEMGNLGWSKHPKLLERGDLDDVLSRSLIRYHRFLGLMATTYNLLTPTLDIDLAWHTHQLRARYYDHCQMLVGRFINHDDAIETGILKDAFDRTAQLWKSKYGQPYSMCGCVYNNPGTIKKLKALMGSGADATEPGQEAVQSGKGSSFTSRMKGKWRAAKELPGDKQDDAVQWQDATHPSAHQAVIVKEEEHRHDKLREEMVREWAQGKRREGHESAFVYVPHFPFPTAREPPILFVTKTLADPTPLFLESPFDLTQLRLQHAGPLPFLLQPALQHSLCQQRIDWRFDAQRLQPVWSIWHDGCQRLRHGCRCHYGRRMRWRSRWLRRRRWMRRRRRLLIIAPFYPSSLFLTTLAWVQTISKCTCDTHVGTRARLCGQASEARKHLSISSEPRF